MPKKLIMSAQITARMSAGDIKGCASLSPPRISNLSRHVPLPSLRLTGSSAGKPRRRGKLGRFSTSGPAPCPRSPPSSAITSQRYSAQTAGKEGNQRQGERQRRPPDSSLKTLLHYNFNQPPECVATTRQSASRTIESTSC